MVRNIIAAHFEMIVIWYIHFVVSVESKTKRTHAGMFAQRYANYVSWRPAACRELRSSSVPVCVREHFLRTHAQRHERANGAILNSVKTHYVHTCVRVSSPHATAFISKYNIYI